MNNKYSAAILIASTRSSKGQKDDLTGPLLQEFLVNSDFDCLDIKIVPDEVPAITRTLVNLIDVQKADLVLTSGGTGLSPTDVTPEATEIILDRLIPGISEAIRFHSRQKTPYADLSRALAGQRRESIIINLPGSPQGALEAISMIQPILKHALDKIKGDPSDCVPLKNHS